jgi:hypothetical protein
MCMSTSLTERTPGSGRQQYLSAGIASAIEISRRETYRHSPL